MANRSRRRARVMANRSPLSASYFLRLPPTATRRRHLPPLLFLTSRRTTPPTSPPSRSRSILSSFTMPSKASMLMLIARAARSVAAATGRFARVAEQAAGLPPKAEATAATASHALDRVGAGLHRSAAGSPPPAMAAMDAPIYRVVDGRIGPGIPAKDFVGKPKIKFVAEEKDLESDEALWALYERWCKAFNQKRDHDEMVRRFKKFKHIALLVHRTNNANLPYKLAINKFADGKLMEKCANPDKRNNMIARKAGNCTFILKPGDRIFRQVFADFKVVNGKLFVMYPKGSKAFEELNVEYDVFRGKLFVDLPEGHELVVPNDDFLYRGMSW